MPLPKYYAASASVSLAPDSTAFHKDSTSVCYAGVLLGSDGGQDAIGPGSAQTTLIQNWTTGSPSNYWVRCTDNAGNAFGDTFGSWLQLSTNRSWYVVDTVDNVVHVVGNFTLEIATDSGGSNIVATETYTPDAFYSTA